MEVTSGGMKKKRRAMFACCTPSQECSGKMSKETGVKFHGSTKEVQQCEGHYLLKQGFKKLNRRAFVDPETGYVRILTRKAARAKPGKETRYMARPLRIRVW